MADRMYEIISADTWADVYRIIPIEHCIAAFE